MPELPEVETVCRGLNDLIVGRVLKSAHHVESPKSLQANQGDISNFLVDATVESVRRRAKVLMIDLSSQYTLVIHLKMTGQLVFVDENQRFGAGHPNDSLVGQLPDRSTRAVLEFNDSSNLFFNDQRKFGWIKLLPTIEVENIDFMKKVGPEPLEDDFTSQILWDNLQRRKNTTIKAAILDQTVLAGVGNIYVDEGLWGAQIHPATKTKDVTKEQIEKLWYELRSVMTLSIEKGGSTDKNYVDAKGKRGSYLDFARVFRREGLPCLRHPDVLIEKTRVAGRGTHICPVCQAPPTT